MKITTTILYFAILLLSVVQQGCNSPGKGETRGTPIKNLENTRFLGHKGSGNRNAFGNEDLPGNSLEAARNGLKKIDGIEIDLQMSADSTLWLFHDHDIEMCDNSFINIFTLTDEELEKLKECNYKELIKFSDAVLKLSTSDLPEGYISLDIKALQNPKSIKHFGGKSNLADAIMNELTFLSGYAEQFNFMVEIPYPEQLQSFSQFPGDKFLLCLDDKDCISFAQANKCGISISLDFAKRHKSLLNSTEGIPIQLWTPNTGNELFEAMEFSPDFIQSDNVLMLEFVRKYHDTEFIYRSKEELPELKLEDEFEPIHNLKLGQMSQSSFLEICFSANRNFKPEDLLLVTTTGSDSSPHLWHSYEIYSGENRVIEFVNIDFLKPEEMKIYFWNRNTTEALVKNVSIRLMEPT